MVYWPVKMVLKMVFARSGLSRELLNNLGMFRHGYNAQAEYAFGVFRKHHQIVAPPQGFTCLEMGPGDSLASAVLTKAFGGARSIQIDVGDYASQDIQVYRDIAAFAARNGLNPPSLDGCETLEDVLTRCDARYLTSGLASFAEIPSGSVDFIYSQAVLEHIRTHEFSDMMREIRRVLKKDGAASHRVDLQDHLAGQLNNLRFSDAVWEKPFMVNSGFYTNRMSFREITGAMRDAGLHIEVREVDRWDVAPTPREAMAPQFQSRTDEELRINGFSVVCRPG